MASKCNLIQLGKTYNPENKKKMKEERVGWGYGLKRAKVKNI